MTRDLSVGKMVALVVVCACVLGAAAGAAAAWLSNDYQVIPRLQRLTDQVSQLGNVVTSTKPTVPSPDTVVVIPVEGRPLLPAYPAAFTDRRQSSVVQLIKRGKGDGEPVANERVIGTAIAVTSDGWLATVDAALSGLRLADIQVSVAGHVRPIERGVRDLSTGIDYLKISENGLPTPAFVRAADVVSGAAVWRESAPLALAPQLIVAVHAVSPGEPVSSERAGRRFLVTAPSDALAGSAVWDGGGRLLGLLEAPDISGNWRVIPAGPIGSSLSQLLQNGDIRRASMGVHAFDLSGLVLDASSSTLPELGAWVHADRKIAAPAVNAKGPSAKLLLDGDVIERIERDILDGTADLGERLLDYRPGVAVSVSGQRAGQVFQTSVTLGTETVSETIK
jgi:S1-C subfamily serine protease